jgi:ubiquinone/menaquinone biosynthesis C-methylase UbiE
MTATDTHWTERAREVADPAAVSIEDTYQRELELDFVCRHLHPGDRLLEVGCGNGYNTTRFRPLVGSVDAFDYSAAMIERAKTDYPNAGVRYAVASVLDPDTAAPGSYDVVVCIRTLINLADLADQRTAVSNMLRWLRLGGRLILVEGFANGFRELDALRTAMGLPTLKPAAINTYSDVRDLYDIVADGNEIVAKFHTGTWDLLTRVALPQIAGPEQGVGPFHPTLLALANVIGNDRTERYARVRGWVVKR